MNINYHNQVSPNFQARTTINFDKNLLSKEEVKVLTKMGEKIGFNSDNIAFSVRDMGDRFGVAHKAKFATHNGGTLETEQSKIISMKSIKPFDFIKRKMESIKKLYESSMC